jgi:hypothetical protein
VDWGDRPATTLTAGPDGRVTLTLPALAAVTLASEAPPSDPAATESWLLDWAGRPLQPLPPAATVTRIAPTPFTRAGLGFELDGPLPGAAPLDARGPVAEVFPGGIFTYRISLPGGDRAGLTLAATAWHDTQREWTGDDLARLVTLTPEPTRGHADDDTAYCLTVRLPWERAWPTDRDHLLSLALSFTADGRRATDERVLRFRLVPGHDWDWRWTGPTAGRLALRPRYPATLYLTPPSRWRLRPEFSGGRLTQRWHDRLTGHLEFAADPLKPTTELLSFRASLLAAGRVVETVELDQLARDGEALLRADLPRAATAHRAPTPDFTAAWPAPLALTAGATPLTHYLQRGARAFSGEPVSAWLAWNDQHLLWVTHVAARQQPWRAETTQPDRPFLGDHVVSLLLAAPAGDRVYLLQVNPRGTRWDAIVAPAPDLAWDSRTLVYTNHDEQAWHTVVALPWAALGLDHAPRPGTTLRLNLGYAHDIAPRRMATWSYWGGPGELAASLAPLTLAE